MLLPYQNYDAIHRLAKKPEVLFSFKLSEEWDTQQYIKAWTSKLCLPDNIQNFLDSNVFSISNYNIHIIEGSNGFFSMELLSTNLVDLNEYDYE